MYINIDMARTWMVDARKGDVEYDNGLCEFFDFVESNNLNNLKRIPCPCDRCCNTDYLSVTNVRIHLEKYKFSETYTRWIYHGESLVDDDESSEDKQEFVGEDEGENERMEDTDIEESGT